MYVNKLNDSNLWQILYLRNKKNTSYHLKTFASQAV